MHNKPFFSKMFRVEVRDKQVYDNSAGDYGILNRNKLSLLEIQEWLIDVNLAIKYLLTNFYINKNYHMTSRLGVE